MRLPWRVEPIRDDEGEALGWQIVDADDRFVCGAFTADDRRAVVKVRLENAAAAVNGGR